MSANSNTVLPWEEALSTQHDAPTFLLVLHVRIFKLGLVLDDGLPQGFQVNQVLPMLVKLHLDKIAARQILKSSSLTRFPRVFV